ncbi:BON domain-containing protein [Luteimonas sp. A482]
MRNSNRSRWGHRPDNEHNVAGVGELRAVAERLLETGAQYLEQGREWLHAATRREQGDDHPPRHDGGEQFNGPRSGFQGGRADAGRDDWSTPRREAETGYARYTSDEHSFSAGGDHGARARRGGHDYDDRPAREFDARADELARNRGRPGWESRHEEQAGARHYGSQPGGFRPHEDDYLPGSFGFGGEGRRQAGGRPAGRAGGTQGAEDASSRWEQAYRTQGQGSHRGRGPRGYTRSDARILDEVNERLCDDPIVDATDIEVRCEQGSVVLEGKVPTRWMKHRAEDIADSISGVKDLDNRIQVAAEEPAAQGDFDTSTTTGARGGDDSARTRGASEPGSGTSATGSTGAAGGSGSTDGTPSAGGTGGSSSTGQTAQGGTQTPQQPH